MQNNPNFLMNLVPMAAIFVIFYFLLIRPQQKQAQDHKKMLEELKKGDRVLTSGGLYGVIAGFRGTDVELKLSENVKVLVTRASITLRVASETPANSNGVVTPS